MNSFIVTYDLKKTNTNDRSEDYDKLYKKLKSYYRSATVTESSWIVKTSFTSEQLRDDIDSYLKFGDALFVANLTGEAAWEYCLDTGEKIKAAL